MLQRPLLVPTLWFIVGILLTEHFSIPLKASAALGLLGLCGQLHALTRRRAEERGDRWHAFGTALATLSLGALAWAAAGKDEGLNPRLILDLADRFARYRQVDIDALHLAKPLRLSELKAQWSAAIQDGRSLVERLPVEEIGCLYLDPETQQAVNPAPGAPGFAALIRHRGTVGGTWPVTIRNS